MSFCISPEVSVGPVVLKVESLETVVSFYREVIGLPVLSSDVSEISLGFDAGPLVVLRRQENGIRLARTTGLFHLALLVTSRLDLALWLRNFIKVGGPGWQGASDHGASEALYLSDPEGNGIEIAWDRPRDQWEVNEDGRIMLVTKPLNLNDLVSLSDSDVYNGLPEDTTIGHVHLSVSDIDASKRFYLDVLGFGEKADLGSALFVAAGDYHHHIGLNVWNSRNAPAPPENAFGLDHVTLAFPNERSLSSVVSRCADADVATHKMEDSVKVIDPSGIKWDLSVRS